MVVVSKQRVTVSFDVEREGGVEGNWGTHSFATTLKGVMNDSDYFYPQLTVDNVTIDNVEDIPAPVYDAEVTVTFTVPWGSEDINFVKFAYIRDTVASARRFGDLVIDNVRVAEITAVPAVDDSEEHSE